MRAASERGFAREGSSASCSAVDFQETNELQFSSTQGVFCETELALDNNTSALSFTFFRHHQIISRLLPGQCCLSLGALAQQHEVVTPEESADRNSHIPRLLNYIVNIDPQHKRIRILVTGCGGDEESL
ncbi:hypothetical protein F2P81_020041 [Scophthalmus maximus]|uniref:Uncharacterized protein n=1 Tax=Scophthalmus maximus TaxID=52904 RepID=A0A6A4S6X0_SCOMX|nr:hypothetical protein F2P81_020041 [Scophthalmus maximus]